MTETTRDILQVILALGIGAIISAILIYFTKGIIFISKLIKKHQLKKKIEKFTDAVLPLKRLK